MNEILIPVLEEPPRKNWKKTAGILTVCCLMVLCISGIMYIVYNTPERRIMRGFVHLAEEIEKIQSEDSSLQGEGSGSMDESNVLQSSGLQVSAKLNVSGENLPNTIGVDTILLIELEEQGRNIQEQNGQGENIQEQSIQEEDIYNGYRISADTKFSVVNNELAIIRFYIDEREDLIQIALPDFWDGHLELTQDNLDSQYNKSVIADYWGTVPENGISLHLPTKRLTTKQLLNGMIVEEIGDVTVEKTEDKDMTAGTVTEMTRRYKCKQYKVWFPEFGITTEIALDRKNYIREIILSEPRKIVEGKSDMGTGVLPEMICVESAQLMMLGERHSIDDISVSAGIRIESEKWNWLTATSFEKGLLQADLELEGKVICKEKGRNDKAVSFELSELTISVDDLGEYRVTGTTSTDRPAILPQPLTGEAVAITELPEETYLEIEENIRKEIEKWQKTYFVS